MAGRLHYILDDNQQVIDINIIPEASDDDAEDDLDDTEDEIETEAP